MLQINIPRYERPVTRIIQVKMTGALLTTSSKDAELGGFDNQWNDSFWPE